MDLKAKLMSQLLKLLDYNKCECVVFVDGEPGFYTYSSLQNFINLVRSGDCTIPEIDTYVLNNATIQKSLFDDDEDTIFIFLV